MNTPLKFHRRTTMSTARIAPTRLLAASLLIFMGVLPLSAQQSASSAPTADTDRIHPKRNEAYDAFKRGDTTGGLAKLAEKASKTKNADLQMGEDLAAISCRLHNDTDRLHAKQAAILSIERLLRARSLVPPKQAARALALAAQLQDHVLGDPAEARKAYQQSLAADPTQALVAERLAYLIAVEERATEKAAGNEVLRARAAQGPR